MRAGFDLISQRRLVILSIIVLFLAMLPAVFALSIDFGENAQGSVTDWLDGYGTYSFYVPMTYQGCFVQIGVDEDPGGYDYYETCDLDCDVYVSIGSCQNQLYCKVQVSPAQIHYVTFTPNDYCGGCSPEYTLTKYGWCGDGTCLSTGPASCIGGQLVEEDCHNCPGDCLESGQVCCESSPGNWNKYSSSYYDLDCCDDSDCSSGYECQSYRCVAEPTCGNGVCSLIAEAENCQVCPADCSIPTGACCAPSSPNAVSSGYVFSGGMIDSTHVCCSGSSYTGECCDDDDCGWDEACSSHQCVGSGPTCGDGSCGSGEDCSSCPGDCSCYSSQCCSANSLNANSGGCVSSGYSTIYGKICCSGTEYTGSCCSDSGCSSGYTCTNHYCVSGGTGLGLCQDCNYNSDCASGYCTSFASGRKRCTTGAAGSCCEDHWIEGYTQGVDCCGDSTCTGGKKCVNYKCVAEAEKASNGESCSSDSGCGSGNCGNGVCCASGKTCCSEDDDCSSGYRCGSSYYCVAGGTKDLCDACSYDSDCESGYCASFADGSYRCTTGVSGTCCDDGTWIAGYTSNVDCCSDLACGTGKRCVNHKCVEGFGGNANGASCTQGSDCGSGNCRGVCCEAGEMCCSYNIDCTESRECDTDNHYCVHTSDQCSPGCRDSELGDGSCDALCDTVECNFDEGDCERRGRCNDDDFCDSSEGEDCENCPNDCGCATFQCCAPDTSYAEPDSRGCIAGNERIDSSYICCDGSKTAAGWGKTCEDVWESEKKPYGASCTSDDECKSGHCESGVCCSASYAEGENCCRDHSDCSSDRYCSDYHRCEKKLANGVYCNLNVECRSGKCLNSECYEAPELMTYGETCQYSSDCESGLACRKGRDTSRMFCCPEGNEYCCSQDSDCAEAAVNDYYCYKGTDPDPGKWFSCQPTAETVREQEYQAKRLSGEEKGKLGEQCSGDADCWSGHCANGYCCQWGTCCATNSDCADGACVPGYYRCVTESSEEYAERTRGSIENALENKVKSKHVEESREDILGLEAEFYVSTPSKEGKGIIGKKLTSVLVIGNRGDENIYVKARIEDKISTHMKNERYEIGLWNPEKDKTWLDRVPVINWVVNALKKVGAWLWETVQDLWAKDDEGFYMIGPGTVFSITYEFEPTGEGWYNFEAEVRYYSKMGGGEIFTHDSNTNTYEMKEIKDITTVKFEKRIMVRKPDCGLLGLVCS